MPTALIALVGALGARAHCVLLGEPQRCALLKQALDEGTVPRAAPPQVHVLSA